MDNIIGAYLGAAICMGLAALGGALGIGMMMSRLFDSVARQPEILDRVRPLVFIGIAFIETVALYGLVISILLATK
ncbi:F0F1 ATP synthase subunit C [Candidatus Termititenax persephonae]|uniref:ATP synthase subunit c n=1 Tax=Candidatus Termititenax persephonae TaxID=2218525 RepID=A0A388THI5_9BACT|nr:F0F1 ATP synthase subunit C [Candidatus Termititenax persephonae]